MIAPDYHPDLYVFIDYLNRMRCGRANAILARDLKRALGFSDRYCRTLAHEANNLGHLIIADNAGYFMPSSPAEIDECVGRLRSQGHKMLERANRIEKLARRKFEQLHYQLEMFG